jgi:hypothetical protein
MVKSVTKHNRWVVFYTLMIASFFLFAFVSIGILNFKVPNLPFDTKSPDFAVSKVKALCELSKYENIVLRSVKLENGEYQLISKDDLLVKPTVSSDYLGVAKALCNALSYNRKFEGEKISDSEWSYTYHFGLVFNASRTYKVVYFDGDWRFVF